MTDTIAWIAALVLHTTDGNQLETVIKAPTQAECAAQVEAWMDEHAANMLRVYDDSWVDVSRADCAMISGSELAEVERMFDPWVPPPPLPPENRTEANAGRNTDT